MKNREFAKELEQRGLDMDTAVGQRIVKLQSIHAVCEDLGDRDAYYGAVRYYLKRNGYAPIWRKVTATEIRQKAAELIGNNAVNIRDDVADYFSVSPYYVSDVLDGRIDE
jgi:hypothetical protein